MVSSMNEDMIQDLLLLDMIVLYLLTAFDTPDLCIISSCFIMAPP